MPIRVYLLQAPYAVAAGTTIQQNVKRHGGLPDAITAEFSAWSKAHAALDAALPKSRLAADLDPSLDRALTAPAYVCEALITGYQNSVEPLLLPQRRHFDDARLVRSLFPEDLRKLVQVRFIEEWAAGRALLQRVTEPAIAAAIDRLGLVPMFEHAARLHAHYGHALGVSIPTSSVDDASSRLAAWNNAFADLIVAARYLGKQHPGLFDVFSAPYEEQLHRQQAPKAAKSKTEAEAETASA